MNSAASLLDGTIALAQARTIDSFGSRAYATPGYRKTLAYLRRELTRLGWETTFQAFDVSTPVGPRTYTNLLASLPNTARTPNRVILTAHYDARGSSTIEFPAASAGAAGCGILLEIAERLQSRPDLARRVQLVFLDGEEPTRQISATDGLSGSRFFLHSLVENGRVPDFRALLSLGAIGHPAARWVMPPLTDPVLNQSLRAYAVLQKWDNQIIATDYPSWGAHLPALQAGLPATLLNDNTFQALGTADDTPDKLDAESLRRAASAALQLLDLPSLSEPSSAENKLGH